MEKDEITKNLLKKASLITQRIDKLKNSVDQQEQYSRLNCLLVHGIAEANDENIDDLVLKTINDKLDANIAEKEIDRSHRIYNKKDGYRPIIINTRKKFCKEEKVNRNNC